MVDKIIYKGRWEARVDMQILANASLSDTEKLVYIALMGHADKTGAAFPKNKTLAVYASCSERQVQRATRRLVTCGLLHKKPQFNSSREQISNLYEIYDSDCFKDFPSDEKEETERHDSVSPSLEKSAGDAHDTQSPPTATTQSHGRGDSVACQEHPHINNKNNKTYVSDVHDIGEKSDTSKVLKVSKKPNTGGTDYSADFESFWQVYPHYNRRKSAAYAEWQRLVKQKVSPAVLVDAAVRYAGECRAQCIEKKYTLHASTFLGPKKEAWKDYTGPNIQMGREIKDAIDVEKFNLEGGRIDAIAYERARRGLGQKTQPGAGG